MYGLDKKVIEAIVQLGKHYGVDKVVLFGSRARGDYKERSDIDIAVYGDVCETFILDINEKIPTLLKFDVVDMGKSVQKDLNAAIEREGVIIYEKV